MPNPTPERLTAKRLAEVAAFVEAQKFGPNAENGGFACDSCGGVSTQERRAGNWAAWPAHGDDCEIKMLVDLLADRARVWQAGAEAGREAAAKWVGDHADHRQLGPVIHRPDYEQLEQGIRALPIPEPPEGAR